MVSKSQLKKASERLRHGTQTPQDFTAVETYRSSLIPDMFLVLDKINHCLTGQVGYLKTGRPKRTKSIIRKLQRAATGTSIGRMIDIVGVRVIVDNRESQNTAIDLISQNCDVQQTKDYLSRKEGYRAIHLYIGENGASVEAQVRTLPQQLWANECERLGERAKEGTWTDEQRAYLEWLAIACQCLDDQKDLPSDLTDNPIKNSRNPITALLPRYQQAFADRQILNKSMKLYLSIYDSWTTDLINCFEYPIPDLEDALVDYHEKVRRLPEDRYDLLLLNSSSEQALQITHPTYFPLH